MAVYTLNASPAELELQRVAAMVNADIDALDRLLHERLVFGHTNGQADDKHTYLQKFRTGAVKYADASHRIENVTTIGGVALVTSHLKMRADLASGPLHINVVALTVWISELGHWR